MDDDSSDSDTYEAASLDCAKAAPGKASTRRPKARTDLFMTDP